jgi:hypothetical protein
MSASRHTWSRGPRLARLYAWVVVEADGSERLAAVGGLPLVSPQPHLARDLMQRAAERVALALQEEAPGARVELRMFDQFEPDGRG